MKVANLPRTTAYLALAFSLSNTSRTNPPNVSESTRFLGKPIGAASDPCQRLGVVRIGVPSGLRGGFVPDLRSNRLWLDKDDVDAVREQLPP